MTTLVPTLPAGVTRETLGGLRPGATTVTVSENVWKFFVPVTTASVAVTTKVWSPAAALASGTAVPGVHGVLATPSTVHVYVTGVDASVAAVNVQLRLAGAVGFGGVTGVWL